MVEKRDHQRQRLMSQHPPERFFVPAQNEIESALAQRGTESRASLRSCGRSRRAHIIGVVVSEITSDIRIATDSVTANSRNRRPTIPPISRMGMNTAISEMLMDITVKPISPAPLQRRLHRRHPVLQMARDVFDHHDRVIHHESGGDGQRHQRKIVQAVAEQVQHAERRHQRDRNHHGGNQRGAHAAQEDEDHHDHQRTWRWPWCAGRREPRRGSWWCGRSGCATSIAAGIEACNCGSTACTRSTVSMIFAAGWRKMIHQHRRLAVRDSRHCECRRPNRSPSATSDSVTAAPLR